MPFARLGIGLREYLELFDCLFATSTHDEHLLIRMIGGQVAL